MKRYSHVTDDIQEEAAIRLEESFSIKITHDKQ
jgi:hypothetical protein